MSDKKLKELKREVEFLKREAFLDLYTDFNIWLDSIGFRVARYDESDISSYHYSHYDKFIDSLYGVENYLHNTLKLRLTFMRDRYEHKYMIVDVMGSHSDVMTQEEFKVTMGDLVRKCRDELQAKLNEIVV